jgi:hypothetical protein
MKGKGKFKQARAKGVEDRNEEETNTTRRHHERA